MAVDDTLLEILVCPEDKSGLELIPLPDPLRVELVERYRDQFRDGEPEVREGLRCERCGRVYPIVSDIPVMLVDEAVPAERAAPARS